METTALGEANVKSECLNEKISLRAMVVTRRGALGAIVLALLVAGFAEPCQADSIYFTPSNDPARLNSFPLTGGPIRTLPAAVQAGTPISIDDETATIYFVDSNAHFRRMNLNGTEGESFPALGTVPRADFELDAVNGVFYYPTPRTINRAVIGNGVTTLVDEPTILGRGEFRGLAIDNTAGQLYFTFIGDESLAISDKIGRVGIDGSNLTVLIDLGIRAGKPGSTLADIEIDVGSGKMYWTDQRAANFTGTIFRADLTGEAIEPLLVGQWGRGLALDLAHGHVYWGSPFSSFGAGLLRSNLDGSNAELFLAHPGDIHGIDIGPDATAPRDVAEPYAAALIAVVIGSLLIAIGRGRDSKCSLKDKSIA
jgi:hypothetical protein